MFLSEPLKQTVRIVRKPKVETDKLGHSVWAETVQTAELELVSTMMLKQILESDNEKAKRRIKLAAQGKDGVLARHAESNRFEIIDDDDLQAAIDSAANTPDLVRPAEVVHEPLSARVDLDDEELSLVSTQMLRQMLDVEDPSKDGDDVGSDPYNSG